MQKAFEMAERLGGMTAFELMDRMTLEELNLWIEYDNCIIPKSTYQFAALMAKIDWHKGVKHPDMKRYLPKVRKKPGRKKSFSELKRHFDSVVMLSGGMKKGKGADDGGR